jgi:hypothetical protein
MTTKPRIEVGTLRLFQATERKDITAEQAFEAWLIEYCGQCYIRNPSELKKEIAKNPGLSKAMARVIARCRDNE